MAGMQGGGAAAFSHATVGVADIDSAIAFWVRLFGMEVRARRDGPDAQLALLWGLNAGDITRQALVRTPGARAGWLHFVEFARPDPPVRLNAQVGDLLPKNLDVYTDDMAARFEQLKAQDVPFRSDPITSPGPDGMVFKEVHMSGHDETNIVLLEVNGKGYQTRYSPRGFAGIGPLVTIVRDIAAEEAFYKGVLGLETTLALKLGGPGMENMIGLPPGASLNLRVYGDPTEPLGRIEAIEYEKTQGANLYGRAKAPALGTLHVTYRVPELAPLREKLRRSGTETTDYGPLELLYGIGEVIAFQSPSGFRIEVQESGA
jgi:catechol 2,3-dioxygenase-like lactoylglutathione lyase family enzyme